MPLAVVVVQLLALKTALFQERQTAIAAQVESAVSIVKGLAGEATAGKLTEAEARDRAKRILRSVRFGQNDYIFVYRHDGQNLALGPKPDLEGKNLTHLKDANGVFFVKAQGRERR